MLFVDSRRYYLLTIVPIALQLPHRYFIISCSTHLPQIIFHNLHIQNKKASPLVENYLSSLPFSLLSRNRVPTHSFQKFLRLELFK